jgi:hypothetical protein
MNNILAKVIVGSQAYGTNTPESDIDYRGIYLQDKKTFFSIQNESFFGVNKDESYQEMGKALELMYKGNPNMIELLFSPEDCIVETSDFFNELRGLRDKFLSKQLFKTFGNYAKTQIEKASAKDKFINWNEDRKKPKEFTDFCFVLDNYHTIPLKEYMDTNAILLSDIAITNTPHISDLYSCFITKKGNGLKLNGTNGLVYSSIEKGIYSDFYLIYNKDAYTKHVSDYNNYINWTKIRNEQRYIDNLSHESKYDGKNIMHCKRLLEMCVELAETNTLNIRRNNVDYLLSIKKGKVDLDKILDDCNQDISKLNELSMKSSLPDSVDYDFVNDLVVHYRTKFY